MGNKRVKATSDGEGHRSRKSRGPRNLRNSAAPREREREQALCQFGPDVENGRRQRLVGGREQLLKKGILDDEAIVDGVVPE
ncbi:hypothetical protein PAAG_06562 [Paracoccidioides lutzii Pb01]|uniref:Uncharacterized protein n=1 Tax=Paracoccidioides lutzii (strain ATCC MYA-826 / Pb01) TaxID=502779 RepID=C1H721_PARBA|nr:hypothetical protein PAAG_06562 [Paracoccidioides lutzii Pb01]EEH35515.2 hypothetical protein PAAG_06562 [Paracoccidioides lutzii Pb01]